MRGPYHVTNLKEDAKKFAVFDGERQVSSWSWDFHTSQVWANEMNRIAAEAQQRRWRFGVLIRKESAWVGAHYSAFNKRWCVNLIPFVTVWIVKPGGRVP